jgi:hypothetical protein
MATEARDHLAHLTDAERKEITTRFVVTCPADRALLELTKGDYPKGEAGMVENETDEAVCPACGNPIDYCPGHGEIGDRPGALILRLHDRGDHSHCHPAAGCEVGYPME